MLTKEKNYSVFTVLGDKVETFLGALQMVIIAILVWAVVLMQNILYKKEKQLKMHQV